MESPIRDQIRLDGRWQTRPLDSRTVSAFVPGSWAEKKVVLTPPAENGWTAAQAGGVPLRRDTADQGWLAGPHLKVGQWNTIQTDGNTTGGRLVASNPLHIVGLDAKSANQHSVSVRIRLDGGDEKGLLGIVITLSAASGAHVGGNEVTVSGRTRDLTLEVPVKSYRPGAYRLKAALLAGDRVVDNARVDLTL